MCSVTAARAPAVAESAPTIKLNEEFELTKLNQIIAIEKDVKVQAIGVLNSAYQAVQKPNLFEGLAKTYEPLSEDGYKLPSESQRVQQYVPDLISKVQATMERLFDLTVTKDAANQNATADIVVNGVTLVAGVPVTTLLWLEKQLINLHTFVLKLPVTDVSSVWTWDAQNSVWRSDTVKTMRQRKVTEWLVVVPATQQHPAQTKEVSKDIPEGEWSTTRLSGAVSPAQRDQLLTNLDALRQAVKQAREAANSITVTDVTMGNALLNFLFGGMLPL